MPVSCPDAGETAAAARPDPIPPIAWRRDKAIREFSFPWLMLDFYHSPWIAFKNAGFRFDMLAIGRLQKRFLREE
jgi:hypothetical protein